MAPPKKQKSAKTSPGLAISGFDSWTQTVVGPFCLDPERLSTPFDAFAMRWTYLVARRQQWVDSGRDMRESTAEARQVLEQMGVDRSELELLARSSIVQVHVPWRGEENGWAERILPWEFLIVLALRNLDLGLSMPTIVRYLQAPGAEDEPPSGPIANAVAAIVCPGDKSYGTTRERYQRECALVREHLGTPPLELLLEPSAEDIKRRLERSAGDGALALHFLGVSAAHKSAAPPYEVRPHLWLRGGATEAAWMLFGDAAECLAGPKDRNPRLVTFSFRDTAPRLAVLTVAKGAHAAIGFQDQVTSEISESFYCLFYSKWRSSGWDLCESFSHARRQLSSRLGGTGIVLWSRHPLAVPAPKSPVAKGSIEDAVVDPGMESFSISSEPAEPVAASTPRASASASADAPAPGVAGTSGGGTLGGGETESRIVVDAVAAPVLNYSVLHNQQGAALLKGYESAANAAGATGSIAPVRLFSKFALQRSPKLPDTTEVEVEVTLYAGDDQNTWRQLETLDTPSKDVSANIRVPLTSTLARTLRESLRTTVETSVRWSGKLVHRKSHAVTLLAIDEWRDDGVCHVFLPSFVLPRDPAVIELVRSARRCLCALTDDFSAGFDGYQQGDGAMVDVQVQAIWASLIQDWQLGYINPPPSFSKSSQRLRSPSSVLKERAGTCIDLSILLAACLEYVDIHPFLVLCPGHAFVGYTRFDRGRGDRLMAIQESAVGQAGADLEQGIRAPQSNRILPPWVYDKAYHRAILKELDEGRFAAIEATGLTRGMPFRDACRLGSERLRKRMEFDCLIDVIGARAPGHDVTPLPMIFSI